MVAALVAGSVTGQAVELFGQDGVVEAVERGGGGVELRFHATDAAEIPFGGDDLLEQSFLEGALRPDVGLELSAEFVEF